MSSDLTTEQILAEGLRKANTDNTKAVLKNPELFGFLVSTFNNTVKMASGKPLDVAIGLSGKALATTKVTGKATGSNGMVVGATAAQILLSTASLLSVAGKTPVSVTVTVGAMFAKKTALAMGLAGGDNKQAKCIAALSDLTASALTTGLAVVAGTTGVGAVVLAGSIAQLTLSGYQAYQACKAK